MQKTERLRRFVFGKKYKRLQMSLPWFVQIPLADTHFSENKRLGLLLFEKIQTFVKICGTFVTDQIRRERYILSKPIARKCLKNNTGAPSKKLRLAKRLYNQRWLMLMLLIPVVWYIIFCYIPMGGLILAFKDFKFSKGIFGSDWVGLKNFKDLFTDYYFPLIVRNTVCTSFLKIVFGFPAPIILALMLNELRRTKLKRLVQTVSYLPYFVSWVVVIGMLRLMLSADGGVINRLLVAVGIIDQPISFLQRSNAIWPIAVISDIWKNVGWNTIVYLAAITSIDQTMYEAAALDGAGRFRRIWSITLPSIRSTIIILFIMNLGSLFSSNFDQMYMLNVGSVGDVAETIDTYIYNFGVKQLNYGIGTALNIVRTIVAFVFVSGGNWIAKKIGEDGIW